MDDIVGVPAAGPPKGRGRGRGRRGGVHVYDHMAYPFKKQEKKISYLLQIPIDIRFIKQPPMAKYYLP